MVVRVMVEVRGRRHSWGVPAELTREQLADMREDGVDIFERTYTIPGWAAEARLAAIWCFAEDVFRLRNPFRR